MDIVNEFLDIIDKIINRLNNQKETIINQNNPQRIELNKKIDQYNKLLSNPSDVNLLLNSKISDKDLLSTEDYNNIQFIISFAQISQNVPDNYQEDIKNIVSKLISQLTKKLNELSTINNSSVNQIQNEIDIINDLKDKIKINQNINREDLEFIVKLCQNESVGNNFITHLLMHLTLTSMNQLYQNASIIEDEENIQTELIKENQDLLTFEQLQSVFSSDKRKYKYDFSIIKKQDQTKLMKYGNLQNIEEILDVLDQFDLDMNRQYKGKVALDTLSHSLTRILLFSNANNSLKALTAASNHVLTGNDTKTLVELLKNSGAFYPRKKRYFKKEKGGPGPGESKENITGALDDFPKNLKLISDIYRKLVCTDTSYNYDDASIFKTFASEIYNKRPNFFTSSYDKNIETLKIFDNYNIDPGQYITSLTSFGTIDYSNKLDQFLEIDCYDYIKDNLTMILPWQTHNTIGLLTFLKQELNLDNEEIFRIAHKTVLGKTIEKLEVRHSKIEELLNEKGLSHSLITDIHRYQPSEEEQKKLNYLEGTVENEYDDLEKSFFNNIHSKINYLSKMNHQLPYFTIFNNNYQDPNNELLYRVDGVPISKYKVYRIYDIILAHKHSDSIDTLLYALTRNSNYTQEQYEKIKHTIQKQFGQGEMIK